MRRICTVLLCCVGCSLDEGGLGVAPDAEAGAPPDVIAADVVTNDVVTTDVATDAVDEPSPPPPCSSDGGACTGAIPLGWTLTAFEPNRAAACPVSYASADVVASPTPQSAACTCSCSVTTQPSCELGAVTMKYSSDAQCGNTYATYNITTAGACTDYGAGTFTLASHHSYTKLGVTAGTCATAAVTDATKVGSTAMRTCDPPAGCAEDVCGGAVPNGMRACIVAAGDVVCPAGPFTDKAALIGDDTTLSCGACSACNVTQSACGNGTVKFWGNSSCTTAKGSMAADGNCNTTGGASGVNHFTYENPVQNVVCNAGTSTPSVNLKTKRTVCCRP